MSEKFSDIMGIPVRVNPNVPVGEIWLIDKNGPAAVVEVPGETELNLLYRAIDSDANFLKRCGVIVNIGDLPNAQR